MREQAKLSGVELASRLGWAQSKVSRLETGNQTATADDVLAWASAVGAPEEVRGDLIADLRTVRFEYASWRRQLRAGTARRQRANVVLEARTSLIRVFAPDLVPGLLQTPDYMRNVFSRLISLHGTAEDVEAAVRARIRRQEALYDPARHSRFLLMESALRHQVCPPAVLRAQLHRLVTLVGLANVELALIPFRAVLPVVPSHGFSMFDDKLVLVELTNAELAFRDRLEVALYADVFDRMWRVAVVGEPAAALIEQAAASA